MTLPAVLSVAALRLAASLFVCVDPSGATLLAGAPDSRLHCAPLHGVGNRTVPRVAALDAGDADRFARFAPIVLEASAQFHLPASLIRAIVRCESDSDPRAVSAAGARGLMQLMPETGRALGVEDLDDPRENIFAGVRLLHSLVREFAGNVALALAAYNAGDAAVVRAGGVPPYPETLRYVQEVERLWKRYARRERSLTTRLPNADPSRIDH